MAEIKSTQDNDYHIQDQKHSINQQLIDIIKLQIQHHMKNCKAYKIWYDENSYFSPKNIRLRNTWPIFRHLLILMLL